MKKHSYFPRPPSFQVRGQGVWGGEGVNGSGTFPQKLLQVLEKMSILKFLFFSNSTPPDALSVKFTWAKSPAMGGQMGRSTALCAIRSNRSSSIHNSSIKSSRSRYCFLVLLNLFMPQDNFGTNCRRPRSRATSRAASRATSRNRHRSQPRFCFRYIFLYFPNPVPNQGFASDIFSFIFLILFPTKVLLQIYFPLFS